MKDNENRDLDPIKENQDYNDDYDYDQDTSPEYDAVDSEDYGEDYNDYADDGYADDYADDYAQDDYRDDYYEDRRSQNRGGRRNGRKKRIGSSSNQRQSYDNYGSQNNNYSNSNNQYTIYNEYHESRGVSEFRGGYFDYIGRILLGGLLTILTLGIMLPWAIVLINRYEIDNTYIEGRRLCFDGTAMQLFGNYIKWWFFSIITFGIYGWITRVKMRQWIVKHTHFA